MNRASWVVTRSPGSPLRNCPSTPFLQQTKPCSKSCALQPSCGNDLNSPWASVLCSCLKSRQQMSSNLPILQISALSQKEFVKKNCSIANTDQERERSSNPQ